MSLTEKKKASNARYMAKNWEQINFKVPKGTKALIQQLSMLEDESMMRYIVRACYMRARNAGADSSIIDGLPWCDDLRDGDKET